MTEKRFTPSGKWIKDNNIDKLLNIDFNTITDRNLCCDLLNQINDEKMMNGKIATKYFEENEQLQQDIEYLEEKIKENEWYWNNIDEDRDVWAYKCTEAEKEVKELKEENKQLKEKISEQGVRLDFLVAENTHMGEVLNKNKKLKQINKGQELEIVRLHKLADAMSSVLRELGIYDVYNEEQINSVKERLR